jgi:hypothetical protein
VQLRGDSSSSGTGYCGGTVVAAASVAAEILSGVAGAARNITGELLSDSSD